MPAQSVAYGLPHDEALKAAMLNAAQIFGLADQLGTLEAGKFGNLIVTNGDPLEIQTQVKYLFIKGSADQLGQSPFGFLRKISETPATSRHNSDRHTRPTRQ